MTFFINGCGFLTHRPSKPVLETRQAAAPAVRGRIIQPERLGQPAQLVIVPFTAGPGVVASDELDRIALMIVKGAADTLREEKSPFTVVFAAGAATAQMALEGHVTEQKTRRVFSAWKWRKIGKTLSVEGRMLDRKTQEPILSFSQTRSTQARDQGFEDLGYSIGQDIARFILRSEP